MSDVTFSHDIELQTVAPWDPTFGSGEPGLFLVNTCHACGALVDHAALDLHAQSHERRS